MTSLKNVPYEIQLQGLSHDEIANIRFSLRILGYHNIDIKLARMLLLNSQRLRTRQELIESQRRELANQRHKIQDLMIELGRKTDAERQSRRS